MRRILLLVPLVTACGDDGVRHTPDAAPHDGPITNPDAPGDASALPVSITTTAGNAPVAGVHVYFLNADSSVALATTTDANGTASAVMAAGGSVTAIDPYTQLAFGGVSDEIDTYFGVKPGDHLHLTLGGTATSINVTVTANIDPNAAATSVYTACGDVQLQQDGTGAFSLSNCGASTDFLVVSYDQNATPLNEAFAGGVAISDGAQIDLTGHAFAAVPTRTYTYTNQPTEMSFSFRDSVVNARGPVYAINGSTSLTTTLPCPTFANAGDVMNTNVYPGGANAVTFLDWGPYADTYTTDVGARMPPAFSGAPAFDATTHTLSFSEDAGGATPDFVYATVSGFRQADARSWQWRIAAPHATSITFPTLPTDVYDFNFRTTDQPDCSQLMIGQVPGGYDAVRPFMLSQKSVQPTDFVLGASGSATLQQYALLSQFPTLTGRHGR